MLRKTYRFRLNTLYIIPFLFLGGLLPRLYYLQVVRKPYYAERAAEQQNKTIKIVPSRGKILDRNGRELAGSTLMESAYVAPSLIKREHAPDLARDLSEVLQKDYDAMFAKITGKREVALERKLDVDRVNAIRAVMRKHKANVPPAAVYFVQEGKRFYPRSELAAHVVGYTEPNDMGDNKGLAGIERTYDKELRGNPEKYRVRRTAGRNVLEPADEDVLASTYGNSVVLTIDETIQHAAENSLKRRVREVMADAGVAVVYGIKTGEILAIANCPSYSLNDLAHASAAERRNRALTDVIEPGSVMKAMTFAILLQEGKVSLDDSFNCEGGVWTTVNGRVVKDTKSLGTAPVRDIFKYSSNIGTIKAASRLQPSKLYEYLRKFGLGEKTGLDLTGEGRGILYPVRDWSALTMSSIPVGYELQITAIQGAAAIGAIANGGWYMQPHIVREIQDYRGETVRRIEPQRLRQVISAGVSRKLLELMELVVTEGTAKGAALEHHRAGGKTGTTKKLDPETRRYMDAAYIASFCGVAPIENPEICVYVWIDNPRIEYHGGQASAPVFKEVAEASLKVLKVPVSVETRRVPSMDIALQKIRTKWETDFSDSYTESNDRLLTGSMPNLEGLTMKEAQEKLLELKLPFTFSGTGVVVQQKPKPYVTIEPGDSAQVVFGSERTLFEQRGDPQIDATAIIPERDTTASLVIADGTNSVVVPVNLPEPAATPGILPRPARPTPTPVPDEDSYASRRPNPAVAKANWSRWLKDKDKLAEE